MLGQKQVPELSTGLLYCFYYKFVSATAMLEARIIDNSQYNNLLVQNIALWSLYHTKIQAFQDKM